MYLDGMRGWTMTGLAFGRERRLTSAKQYSRVMRPGAIRAGHARFTVIARPNDGPHARLGLAIAKKHVRRAVDRNRIKRLVREEGFEPPTD